MNDKQKNNFSSRCLMVVSILLSYVVMDTGNNLLVHYECSYYTLRITALNLDFSDILRISTPKMRMWDKFYDNHFCQLYTFLY